MAVPIETMGSESRDFGPADYGCVQHSDAATQLLRSKTQAEADRGIGHVGDVGVVFAGMRPQELEGLRRYDSLRAGR
jgi:hypothetical protein